MIPQEEMLDYALGGLDEAERDRIEAELATDPELAAAVGRLDRNLDLLLDDGQEYEPPANLARRTVAFVTDYRPRRSILEFAPVKVPFRWADVAVAASIFFAGLVTLLPAVHRAQLQNDETVCTFNLGQIGRSLANYATTHGKYPYPPANSPVAYAGVFKVMLHDSGHLVDQAILDCPSNGKATRSAVIPSYQDTVALFNSSHDDFHHMICGDYAYHVGVVQPTGEPGPLPSILTERLPIASDQPGHDHKGHILEGNSPNHRGIGQNVLYTDGHVSWHSSRSVGPVDDDIFLNDDDRPEPSQRPQDAVLAPGCFPISKTHVMGR